MCHTGQLSARQDFQSSPFSKEGIIEGNFQYLDGGGLRIRVELCINIDSDDHIMIMERRVLSCTKQTLKCLKVVGPLLSFPHSRKIQALGTVPVTCP